MSTNYYLILISFFAIAFIYSSVGFGGGSSYLALLAQPFFQLLPDAIRPTALLCNIVVVTAGTIIFYKQNKIDWKEVWPFCVASVPMALLGGMWKLSQQSFFLLLAFTLIVASVLLWVQLESLAQKGSWLQRRDAKIAVGGSIGFLSGLVGIGGGIFLAPILHFFNWAEANRISALASVFIFVNSIGGLMGQFFQKGIDLELSFILPLLLAVFVGGQLGSRVGARHLSPKYIKRITSFLIFFAALNILRDHI